LGALAASVTDLQTVACIMCFLSKAAVGNFAGWMPIGACPGTETVPELAGETPAPLDVAEGRARFMVIKVILRGFLMIFGFGHGVWSQGLRQAGNHS